MYDTSMSPVHRGFEVDILNAKEAAALMSAGGKKKLFYDKFILVEDDPEKVGILVFATEELAISAFQKISQLCGLSQFDIPKLDQ